MHAYIVVDLGFGDAGKGLLTDFLVRYCPADLVVRYNGGAQAGHNVVTADGHHHTFSQFGSGTFIPHVKTYLSRHVVVHPTALLVEGDILERKGVQNPFARIRLSDQALVITPFHQTANRIREIVRGANRHGSCGVGVGETVEDALLYPSNRILAGELNKPDLLQRKLRSIRNQKREQVAELCQEHPFETSREFEVFERDDVIDTWISTIARIGELGLVVPDSILEQWLQESDNVVFEGAQGILLDEDAGFPPFVTWSRCTSANALEIINEMIPSSEVFKIGVMRSYAVRHGPGPLPTETDILNPIVSEHNAYNEWQGNVRYGWFDSILARYALSVIGRVDMLAVTHLDVLADLKSWKYCVGYQGYQKTSKTSIVSTTSDDGVLTGFRIPPDLSLVERTQFTQALSTVTPVLNNCDADTEKVVREIELLIGKQVGIVSYGPCARDVQTLSSFSS